MSLNIPENISAVDNNWLSAALDKPIAAVEFSQIGQGVGIMGDIFRAHLTYAAGTQGPDSVVVKLPSSFEENRAQGVALGMFEAEVRFYNELAHRASVGIPEVYLAAIESGTANFVIVMEDLNAHTMVEQQVGMTVSQAHAAVEVLAKIHAIWWGDVHNDAMNWIPSMTSARIEFIDQFLPTVFNAFADGFRDLLPPGGFEIYETFVGNYLKLTKVISDRSPWTLVHQDYRVENLMFSNDNTNSVIVLDWQGIGRGPGAYDLAYVLGGSMASDLRRENEQALLKTYHKTLETQGVSNFSLDQCTEDYALSQLMGGLATPILIGGAMDLSNERGKDLIATMAIRHVQAALDHNGLERLQAIV